MALAPGARLGPYEILSALGAGGMGEVYKARDTRLDRRVALKVIAPQLTGDDEFRQRFTREAKAISALNHSHICGLYDIGREHEIDYLVLELLEGETLSARLARGPLPLSQVLRYGIEIADALESAHRQGMVHRDLKPGNVMLTPAGTKLLDFGLAKHAAGAAAHELSMLVTAPGTATTQGTILGTLQYMAPEQVQGQPVDARTDIFALGAVLHEMATGRRAFEATTQAGLIAKILETELPVVSSIAPRTPPALDHVVQSCLAKAPADRWQTAHDVKLELEWIQAQGSGSEQVRSGWLPHRRRTWIPWTVAAGLFVLAATGLLVPWPRSSGAPALPVHFELSLPPHIIVDPGVAHRAQQRLGAISPDGRHFVFTAIVDRRFQLVMRSLASTELVVLAGTDGAFNPFWSPDSESVAFFVEGTDYREGFQLKTIAAAGGPARVLAGGGTWASLSELGGTWARGVLLFGPREGRIYRVAETGGTASLLDTLPWKAGQKSVASPSFLPDGRHFTVKVLDDPAVYLASMDAPGARKILDDASSVVYAAGHLFYVREARLFARPFDADRLEFSGAEVRVAAPAGGVSVSDQGTIAYLTELAVEKRLTWFDRSGRRTGTVGEPGAYAQMVLSPRGRRATVVRDTGGESDLWDVDLGSGIVSRLTTAPGYDVDPAWSPDERSLAFSRRLGVDRPTVFVKDLVTGKEDQLVAIDEPAVVDEWTPDGRYVIFRTWGKAVYAVSMSGDRKPRMLVDTPYTEDEVHVSPDGRWVAFNADESGRWEVYIAAFPTFASKRQVSNGGGVEPRWRRDGRELFYLGPDGSMMSIRTDTRAELTVSAPVRLFPTAIRPDEGVGQYGVTPDGQRFLGLERVGGAATFTFLLNWLNEKSSKTPSVAQ